MGRGHKVTGGTINLEDTWVYPISFVFNKKGEWEYEHVDQIVAEFSVLYSNNIRTTLEQFDALVGKSTLSISLVPDGDNKAALEYLLQKANNWSDLIKAGHLECKEA